MDTTNRDVVKLLQQAAENGWSVQEMIKQIDLTWDRWLDPDFTIDGRKLTDEEEQWFYDRKPFYRKENIARTETMRASNYGAHTLYKEWQIGYKEWLAVGDQRTRDTHLDAWKRYSEGGDPGPIPIDQPFSVGGISMMYPGDPSAPAGEVCNCRCTELPYNPEWSR